MKQNLYQYRDYKKYLQDALEERSSTHRGQKSRLAEALNCHTAYISQVLNGSAHLSMEQSDGVNRFIGHTKAEGGFFLLLVQFARAGTTSLRKVFEEQIEVAVEKYFNLKERLAVKKNLNAEDQAIFYSSWHYGAVHVSVSVPGCDTEHGISQHLQIPLEKVNQVLEFLNSVGIVAKKSGRYGVGTTHIHLGSDSPMISKHHTNWRLQAIQSLDEPQPKDLHYSSVITCSANDVDKIRDVLVTAIEKVRAVVRPSKDEEILCYALDLFRLGKTAPR